MSQMTTVGPSLRNIGFFSSTIALPAEYTLIGEGDLREYIPNALDKSAWTSLLGYTPQGNTLADCLFDHLTNGSDPSGASACKPLVPTISGDLELYVAGHSLVKTQKFVWGVHQYTNRLRDLIRLDFRECFNNAQAGLYQDPQHYRRILDYWCDKYGLDKRTGWQGIVPPSLRNQFPGPLPHQTTITESFNKADSDTLGPDLTWTEVDGDWDVVSNAARLESSSPGSGGTFRSAFADTDLSGSDHYSQVNVTSIGSGNDDTLAGPGCRGTFLASETYYDCVVYQNNDTVYLDKTVTNVLTVLTNTAITLAIPEVYKIEANGSTIKAYQAGVERLSTTDTSISSNTKCGIVGYFGVTQKPTVDAFQASDLTVAGIELHRTLQLAGQNLIIPGYLLRP